jgi:hypothetical protein
MLLGRTHRGAGSAVHAVTKPASDKEQDQAIWKWAAHPAADPGGRPAGRGQVAARYWTVRSPRRNATSWPTAWPATSAGAEHSKQHVELSP